MNTIITAFIIQDYNNIQLYITCIILFQRVYVLLKALWKLRYMTC